MLGEQVIARTSELEVENYIETITSQNNLAFILKWQGNHTEALELMRRCVPAEVDLTDEFAHGCERTLIAWLKESPPAVTVDGITEEVW